MTTDLSEKVRQGIMNTGYPLELQAASIARRRGWIVFHSVQYTDPETKKLRELDLLLYKIIAGRRIELRISCKSSSNKQFVFFTQARGFMPAAFDLKFTPVIDDVPLRNQISTELSSLRFFSEDREAVNYTMLLGDKADRDEKALLYDAHMSVVSSVNYRIFPSLLHDPRGVIYFFIVLLKGRMFAATYDDTSGDMSVAETDYIQWAGKYALPEDRFQRVISNVDDKPVPLTNALHWFSDRIRVEFIKDSAFEHHLEHLETALTALPPEAFAAFGKPWAPENSPKNIAPGPTLEPVELVNQDFKSLQKKRRR